MKWFVTDPGGFLCRVLVGCLSLQQCTLNLQNCPCMVGRYDLPAAWQRQVCQCSDAWACAPLKQLFVSPALWLQLSLEAELLALTGFASAHRNGTLGDLVPEKSSTIKNAEVITSFSFHWEEIKINCSSYTRKRELKRYMGLTCWDRGAIYRGRRQVSGVRC